MRHKSLRNRNLLFFFFLFDVENEGDDYHDYEVDYDDYSDDFLGEEEEKEIVYDISFTNSGDTITVDKGTTIRLPCNVDKYPGKTDDYNFASSRLR